ncbi:MAG: carboxypeptidase-like regulatory domain-containing protein, partial [Bacteroidales bacterium]|nr:carboxypeptidase-like regulatory domain-containing protein [Bacteroidales bacterium]
MRNLVLAASLMILPANSWSQVLKGTIKDAQGDPIPYATVYIRELRQGTVANTRGDYELRIPEGKYSVTWQSLGYEPEIRDVTITKTTITINIVLQLQYYQIPEVRITASGEDPAYGIMRKVIGMAPYYLNQVSY